jgi:hypothetical protein
MIYLEMHGTDDGQKLFGVTTAYDWYVLKNTNVAGITTIKSSSGTVEKDLTNIKFIPNGMFDEIDALIARPGEPVVNMQYSAAAYHTQREWMTKTENAEFSHPCVMMVGVDNEPSCIWYSNTDANGHFRVPKLIFPVMGKGICIDQRGDYGMCQHVAAIIDQVNVLPLIQKAMQTERFQTLMKACSVGGLSGTIYNRRVIALFKRDFWQHFVDNEGNPL